MSGPITRDISIRVLFYGKNPEQFFEIKSRLSPHRFKLHRAHTLGNAHEILDESIYHLLLLSGNGDKDSYLYALHDLLRRHARTPMVVATWHKINRDHINAIAKGAQDVLHVPSYDDTELAIRLRFAIERHGLRLDRRLVDDSVELDQTGEYNVIDFRKTAQTVKLAADNFELAVSGRYAKGT